MADAPTIDATYSGPTGGRVPSPWSTRPPPHFGPRSSLIPIQRGLRFALRALGERWVGAPPSPSLRLSKHRTSVKKSSIWSRKKSPIWGMCSVSPRYYDLINRQAGCPLNLPLPERPGFSLASVGGSGPMDRGSFVLLILPLGFLVLEPILVLLPVGHGSAFERISRG